MKQVLERFLEQLTPLLSGNRRIGLMVSGGGDSMALMHLLGAVYAKLPLDTVRIVTVDHGLRAEAKTECMFVSKSAAALGFKADILPVAVDIKNGNIQANARAARYASVVRWAKENDISAVVTGHTETDQAETLLMRLARGSGVDGLAAMKETTSLDGVTLLRPLLAFSRNDLRSYLDLEGINWVEDASNSDDSYHRIQLRNAMPKLNDLGFNESRLAQTAVHMQRAREVLDHALVQFAKEVAEPTAFGSIRIELNWFEKGLAELQTRLLTHAIWWITGQAYRPRFSAIENAVSQIRQRRGFTLNGVMIFVQSGTIHIVREPAAVLSETKDSVWDNRWVVSVQETSLEPVGDERNVYPENWAEFGLPALVWATLPREIGTGHLLFPTDGRTDGQQVCTLKRGIHDFWSMQSSH